MAHEKNINMLARMRDARLKKLACPASTISERSFGLGFHQ